VILQTGCVRDLDSEEEEVERKIEATRKTSWLIVVVDFGLIVVAIDASISVARERERERVVSNECDGVGLEREKLIKAIDAS
jgi:hypothetical protein